jgi:hypothetical protein
VRGRFSDQRTNHPDADELPLQHEPTRYLTHADRRVQPNQRQQPRHREEQYKEEQRARRIGQLREAEWLIIEQEYRLRARQRLQKSPSALPPLSAPPSSTPQGPGNSPTKAKHYLWRPSITWDSKGNAGSDITSSGGGSSTNRPPLGSHRPLYSRPQDLGSESLNHLLWNLNVNKPQSSTLPGGTPPINAEAPPLVERTSLPTTFPGIRGFKNLGRKRQRVRSVKMKRKGTKKRTDMPRMQGTPAPEESAIHARTVLTTVNIASATEAANTIGATMVWRISVLLFTCAYCNQLMTASR